MYIYICIHTYIYIFIYIYKLCAFYRRPSSPLSLSLSHAQRLSLFVSLCLTLSLFVSPYAFEAPNACILPMRSKCMTHVAHMQICAYVNLCTCERDACRFLHVYMHANAYFCMYMHANLCHKCARACICICICVHTHVCICICCDTSCTRLYVKYLHHTHTHTHTHTHAPPDLGKSKAQATMSCLHELKVMHT